MTAITIQKQKVLILDVDGCLVPLQPIQTENVTQEVIQKNTKLLRKARMPAKVHEWLLHEYFDYQWVVITGRKESLLGDVTRKLFDGIHKKVQFLFYPEEYSYASETYLQWKMHHFIAVPRVGCLTDVVYLEDDQQLLTRLQEHLFPCAVKIYTVSWEPTWAPKLMFANVSKFQRNFC